MKTNPAFKPRKLQRKKTNLLDQNRALNTSSDRVQTLNTYATEATEREGLVEKENNSLLKSLLEGEKVKFENGCITTQFYNRLRYVEVANLILAMIGLIGSLIEYDLEYKNVKEDDIDTMLWFILFTTIILCKKCIS